MQSLRQENYSINAYFNGQYRLGIFVAYGDKSFNLATLFAAIEVRDIAASGKDSTCRLAAGEILDHVVSCRNDGKFDW